MRAALALCLIAAPALAVEPDICHFGTPPAGAPVSEYSDANPFLGLDLILADVYVNRALCGLDVSRDAGYWRSYYRAFGCTAASDAGRTLELWLSDAPLFYKSQFDRARARYPEMVDARCTRVARCDIPERFSLTELNFLTCPDEDG